jgi:hypothetical protein
MLVCYPHAILESIFAISPTFRVGLFVILWCFRNRHADQPACLVLFAPGTRQLRSRSPRMTDTELFEQSFNIEWSVLERIELGEPADTTPFLGTISLV